MKIQGLVIHLARATGRRPVTEAIMAHAGVPCRILEAVDGAALDPAEKARVYRRRIHDPDYPFALRDSEIGCFLSHRNSWAALRDSDADAVLVFEDDVAIGLGYSEALTLAQRGLAGSGMVQLQLRDMSGDVRDREGAARLYRPRVTPLRMSCQLISRDAAERLLAATDIFDRPVDTFLQMHWITGVRPAAVSPSGLSDVAQSSGGSTISQEVSASERIVREWKRAAYRRAIRRLSRPVR